MSAIRGDGAVSAPVKVRDKGDVPDDPLSRMRHSASHVMADAVRRLRPGAKVAIGPSIETGFYYDFDTAPFSPDDAAKIGANALAVVRENLGAIERTVDMIVTNLSDSEVYIAPKHEQAAI